MAPPSLTYRTAGAWGAGKGSNLTPAEVDNNFWLTLQWFITEVAALPSANGIANITVSADNVLDIYLDDGTHFGPFNIATKTMTWQGEWQPSTAYSLNDVITVAGSGVYLVTQAHTSALSFDPNAGPGYYSRMMGAADAGTGAGGGITYIWDDTRSSPEPSPWIGDYWLVKPTGTGAWAGHDNDIAYWDGLAWQFIDPTDGMVIFGNLDGKTYPWFKTWAEGSWQPLGNYIKEMQGLYYFSAGFGAWDADDTYPVHMTANAMRFSHAYGYGSGTGAGTGNLQAVWSRRNSSASFYHEFHDGYVARARMGKAAGSEDLTIDVYETIGANWRNGLTISGSAGLLKTRSVTFAQLPSPTGTWEGYRAFCTDAPTGTFGAALSTGGGSNKVPIFCNGSAWCVG